MRFRLIKRIENFHNSQNFQWEEVHLKFRNFIFIDVTLVKGDRVISPSVRA